MTTRHYNQYVLVLLIAASLLPASAYAKTSAPQKPQTASSTATSTVPAFLPAALLFPQPKSANINVYDAANNSYTPQETRTLLGIAAALGSLGGLLLSERLLAALGVRLRMLTRRWRPEFTRTQSDHLYPMHNSVSRT
jgi:hypothetical protein